MCKKCAHMNSLINPKSGVAGRIQRGNEDRNPRVIAALIRERIQKKGGSSANAV